MLALRRLLLGCMALAMFAAAPVHAAPLGTGFTYQGQLNQSGSPITGTAHFRFSLWDAASGGTQLGVNQIVANVLVTSGIFTVQLNAGGEFAATAFNGDARWLQIEVCTDAVCTSQTLLTPRQALTGTPYALQSSNSQFLTHIGGVGLRINPGTTTNVPGMLGNTSVSDLVLGSFLDGGVAHSFISTGYTSNTRKVSIGRASSSDPPTKTFEPLFTVVSNSGNVGVGTSTPEFPLSFPSVTGDKIALTADASGGHAGFGIQSNLMQIHTPNNLSSIGFGYGSSSSFTEKMRIEGSGNVGIGTALPNSKLDVRGDIRYGSAGDVFAAGGQENLRIVRGAINGCATGTIQSGSGFTLEPGCVAPTFTRTITFTTPFSSPPTVTATSISCPGCNTTFCEIVSVSTTQVKIIDYNRSDGGYAGGPLHFIAIGPR